MSYIQTLTTPPNPQRTHTFFKFQNTKDFFLDVSLKLFTKNSWHFRLYQVKTKELILHYFVTSIQLKRKTLVTLVLFCFIYIKISGGSKEFLISTFNYLLSLKLNWQYCIFLSKQNKISYKNLYVQHVQNE